MRMNKYIYYIYILVCKQQLKAVIKACALLLLCRVVSVDSRAVAVVADDYPITFVCWINISVHMATSVVAAARSAFSMLQSSLQCIFIY